MTKRILTLIITLILTLLPLSSCFEGEQDVQTQPDSNAESTSTDTEAETEEVILHSFYATGRFSGEYLNLQPAEGSPEADEWDVIVAESMIRGEVCPYLAEGETVKVVYEGNIEPIELKYEKGGAIQKLHSITIKTDPRTYGGVDYGVAIIRELYYKSKAAEQNINAGKEKMGYDMLIAESTAELEEYRDSIIFPPREITGNVTDEMKESLQRHEQRKTLLAEYNDEFFENNVLLMAFIESGSGTLRFDVSDVSINNGVCLITIDMLNEPITEDMAYWVIFVSIPRAVAESVTEYETYTPTPDWLK